MHMEGIKMAENTEKNTDGEEKASGDKEESLPFCTTAASPEHHRGEELDEPCDDGRAAK